jgi:hypothetical protein
MNIMGEVQTLYLSSHESHTRDFPEMTRDNVTLVTAEQTKMIQ